MTASMGIAYYPKDSPNVIDLIRNADAALYHAKKSGGNVYSFYAPKMNEDSVERLMTKSKLKRSFERDELLVHYQPKYDLETGEVFGAEALVRWELPERGVILPSDFIPIAEETNLIIEIGEWVLDKVCEDFRFWQRSVSSPGRVSVNLSAEAAAATELHPAESAAILRSYEVSPTSLELEITETTLMENPDRTIKIAGPAVRHWDYTSPSMILAPAIRHSAHCSSFRFQHIEDRPVVCAVTCCQITRTTPPSSDTIVQDGPET